MSTSLITPPAGGAFIPDPLRHEEAVRLFLEHYRVHATRRSLLVLQEILAAFAHLPYENLSKIIKFNRHGQDPVQRLRLPEEVVGDHAQWHLGGTCFSLAFLLHSILTQLGYAGYVVMGDMRAGRNLHCALIVVLENVHYLVDPGYVLRRPMALDPAKPRLYHNEFTGVEVRHNAASGGYDLYTFTAREMKWRYHFVDQPTPMAEFHAHWQASFQRNSMHGLCLTRAREEELIFIHKDFMRITSLAGKRNVNLKKSYHATIQQLFGIAPEYVEQALAALQENMARERETGALSARASQ